MTGGRAQGLSVNKFVYYYLKIFGVCPYKLTHQKTLVCCRISTIYTSILCIIYAMIFVCMTKVRSSIMFSCETPISVISDVLSVILEFLTILSVWINAAGLQGVLRDVIKGFSDLSVSVGPFGISTDATNVIKNLDYLVISVNAVYFFLEIFSLILLSHLGYVAQLVWIAFNSFRVLSHLFTGFFIYSFIIVKRHLQFVHEFIRQFPRNFQSLSEVRVPWRRAQCFDNEANCLRALAQVHTDLRDILKMVEIYFRAPLLFFLLTHFINIASYFYVICLHLKKASGATVTPTFLIFFLWLLIHIVEVLATIETVNSVVLLGNRTGNIFHRLVNHHHPDEVVDAVKVISLRILQEPIKFSLYGLIDLNPALLYKVLSAMTTYFVIMIQLDIQNNSDENKC